MPYFAPWIPSQAYRNSTQQSYLPGPGFLASSHTAQHTSCIRYDPNSCGVKIRRLSSKSALHDVQTRMPVGQVSTLAPALSVMLAAFAWLSDLCLHSMRLLPGRTHAAKHSSFCTHLGRSCPLVTFGTVHASHSACL